MATVFDRPVASNDTCKQLHPQRQAADEVASVTGLFAVSHGREHRDSNRFQTLSSVPVQADRSVPATECSGESLCVHAPSRW